MKPVQNKTEHVSTDSDFLAIEIQKIKSLYVFLATDKLSVRHKTCQYNIVVELLHFFFSWCEPHDHDCYIEPVF